MLMLQAALGELISTAIAATVRDEDGAGHPASLFKALLAGRDHPSSAIAQT
jgi:hypothetical protein